MVLGNKKLVIVCDFKFKLFGKLGLRHASTSRRCYACYITLNLESGTMVRTHCGCLHVAIRVSIEKQKLEIN